MKRKKSHKTIPTLIIAVLIPLLLFAWAYFSDPDHWEELPSLVGTESLELAVKEAILEYNSQITPGERIRCESHEIFSIRRHGVIGSRITVYLTYAYEEYTSEQGALTPGYACICPAALTFKPLEDGSYHLLQHWEPRDGVNFSPDLKKYFPDIPTDTIYGLELKSRLLRECREQVLYAP